MTLGSDPAGEVDFQPQLQDVIEPAKFGGYAEQPVVYSTSVAAPAKVGILDWAWGAVTKPVQETIEVAKQNAPGMVEQGVKQLWNQMLNKYVFRTKTEQGTGNVYVEPTPTPTPTTNVSKITERSFWEQVLQPAAQVIAEAPAAAVGGSALLIVGIVALAIFLSSRSK